jgi:WhiB family redox-sensing transcriptional regulator
VAVDKPDVSPQMSEQARWVSRAACREHPRPHIFDTYTKRGVTVIDEDVKEARSVCAGCPVLLRCLRHAVTYEVTHGVWGGLVVEEREAWAREHSAA